jgi:hypothetical protein
MRTRFESHDDLAELPYFRLNEAGRLSLDIDPGYLAIDMHTHLALTYGGLRGPDLHAEHPHTHHYLPTTSPLDLQGYANNNIHPTALRQLQRDLTLRSVGAGGLRATHTGPNLRREMREMGYSHAVILPIDLPVLSNNTAAYLDVARRGPELIAFGSVHPVWRKPGEHLQRQKREGIRGVKLHPAVQLFAPEGERAMTIYRLCADLRLPVLMHAGPVGIETGLGRRLTQMRRYERAIQENPGTTFVLGHSGARQPEIALELAQRHANVWLELSGQGLDSIRTLLRDGPADRIVLGSDWPFYHLAVPLSKVLLATEHDAGLRRAVLRENAARLLGL